MKTNKMYLHIFKGMQLSGVYIIHSDSRSFETAKKIVEVKLKRIHKQKGAQVPHAVHSNGMKENVDFQLDDLIKENHECLDLTMPTRQNAVVYYE